MTDLAGRSGPDGTGSDEVETDGRRLRRATNREAVVDALLDLYREGSLRPGTDEIAERAGISPRSLFRYFEDTDDLVGEAITRQLARAMPIVQVDAEPGDPFADRVRALVDQRFRLFDAVGQAAYATRLRAPFQPRLAEILAESRRFLRNQIRTLFAGELAAMGDRRAEWAVAAADVLATFESFQLMTTDQGCSADEARQVMVESLSVMLTPGGTR